MPVANRPVAARAVETTRPDSARLDHDLGDRPDRRALPRRLAMASSLRAGIFRQRNRAARVGADSAAAPYEPAEVLWPTQKPGRRLLGLAALALVLPVLFECAFWMAHVDRPARPPECAAWDDAARRTLAPMTHEITVVTSRELNVALAQLRRARQSCRAGRLDVARRGYDALTSLSKSSPSSLAQD
jgi:hypothetical protein